jgi:hypothetical protein
VRASAVTVLRKASTLAVVLSASDGTRHSLEGAFSSGRRASSAGTGDATVGAGDSGRGTSVNQECLARRDGAGNLIV